MWRCPKSIRWHFSLLLHWEEKGCPPFTSNLEKGGLRRTSTEIDACFLERGELRGLGSDTPWRIYPLRQLQGALATLVPTVWAKHPQSSKMLSDPDLLFPPNQRNLGELSHGRKEGVRQERNKMSRPRKTQDARLPTQPVGKVQFQ